LNEGKRGQSNGSTEWGRHAEYGDQNSSLGRGPLPPSEVLRGEKKKSRGVCVVRVLGGKLRDHDSE